MNEGHMVLWIKDDIFGVLSHHEKLIVCVWKTLRSVSEQTRVFLFLRSIPHFLVICFALCTSERTQAACRGIFLRLECCGRISVVAARRPR